MVAAFRTDRNSIGVEVEQDYCRMAARYLKAETSNLFSNANLIFEKAEKETALKIREAQALYRVGPSRKKLE
jgi:site-specific DNA-methyltransferase (adenine-specific)